MMNSLFKGGGGASSEDEGGRQVQTSRTPKGRWAGYLKLREMITGVLDAASKGECGDEDSLVNIFFCKWCLAEIWDYECTHCGHRVCDDCCEADEDDEDECICNVCQCGSDSSGD